MSSEGSMYIIKPEAMIFRDEIRKIIRHWSLDILASKHLVLPEWVLREIYPGLSDEDFMGAITTRFREPVEVGLVHGDWAIKKLLAASGTKTAPSECNRESIRFRFGNHRPLLMGNSEYYLNAIHRPENQKEARRSIALFWKLQKPSDTS